jgi:uncharacterized protein
MLAPFHLAFPVHDLEATRVFYTEILRCEVGRESDRWIDFNFYGHQITAHLSPDKASPSATSSVDGQQVPVRHFGLVLPWEEWHLFARRLEELKVSFLIPPGLRFKGEVGEQATLFISDPSGNGLEFKSFRAMTSLFRRD